MRRVLIAFFAGLLLVVTATHASGSHWGEFKADHCTGLGQRQYSAILWDIPWGRSWEAECANSPANINGYDFDHPTRCVNPGVQMWGEFDVPDDSCQPRWGEFKRDHCRAMGHRQYSSILWDIPGGVTWEDACAQAPATVAGHSFATPTRCVNLGVQMWGEFDVPDDSCPRWGEFKKDRCTDSGKRQYSAVLWDIPGGVTWEDACASTPATIQGQRLFKPARCIKAPGGGELAEGKPPGIYMWGEFEVSDTDCSPVTECTDPTPPAGAFAKPGNDGSMSCDTYCANAVMPVGVAGSCVKGVVLSGLHAGSCVRCIDIGRNSGDTDITCYCKAPLTGFADTHNHQFANLAFGGQAVWGEPYGPMETALAHCEDSHGPGGVGDIVFGALRRHGISAVTNPTNLGHFTAGFPEFNGWPHFTSTSHQTVYEDWLYRAYQGGLRLMVMFAVNNEEVCHAVHKAPGRTCDDQEAIRHQIEGPRGAKAMEAYIDNKHGGPGRGWYRIVYSPQQARDAISAGQLAVVLGAEVDYFLDCRKDGDCTEADVADRLRKYREMGLRHIFPIHFVANAFGSAALSNALTHGDSRECAQEDYHYKRDALRTLCGATGLTNLGKFLLEEMIRQKLIIDIDHMSVLARADALAIAESHQIPVISSHTGFIDIADGDERHEGNLKAEEVARIRALGGMVTPIASVGAKLDHIKTWHGTGQPVVEHQCGRTAQSFAQAYLYAVHQMGGAPVGIGTDVNSGPELPGPRFRSGFDLGNAARRVFDIVGTAAAGGQAGAVIGGGNPFFVFGGFVVGAGAGVGIAMENHQKESACPGGQAWWAEQTAFVRYPFPVSVMGSPPALDRSVVGNKKFDINTDGLAHIGMLPDFIEDLKQQGLRPEDLEPLFRSAEGYIRMWEKIEAASSPPLSRVNVALASNGGTVTASTTYDPRFPARGIIDGDRKGLGWERGGGWNDATAGAYPDWIQVEFAGLKTINEVDLFTLQDDYPNPVEPRPDMTFTKFGITDFEVQYWNEAAWVTVPQGRVTGNTKVWSQFTFGNITTNQIRVLIHNALAGHSRVVEIEAYSPSR